MQKSKIAKDSMLHIVLLVLLIEIKDTVLSYLHKAIKALNQLRMIEDSLGYLQIVVEHQNVVFSILMLVILPKVKAEQYLRDVMSRYRNKLVITHNTGEVRDDRKHHEYDGRFLASS